MTTILNMGKHRGLEDMLSIPYPVRLLDLEDVPYEENNQEPIQEGFSHDIFKYIKPGMERVCVVLKAEDFSYGEIAFVLGIERQQVNKIFFDLKTRLIKLKVDKVQRLTK